MKEDYSRREFLKILGIGAATIALTPNLAACDEREEEKIYLSRLSEYHVFKQHYQESDFDDYLFIREHKEEHDYSYLSLIVVEDKYFYENLYAIIANKKEDSIEHIPFEILLDNYELEDLGNAVDVVSSIQGEKPYYMASEINKIPDSLRSNNIGKKLTKTR